MKKLIFSLLIVLSLVFKTFAQIAVSENNKNITPGQGIEDVIIEKYYVNKEAYTDSINNITIPKEAVTYRIYVDLAPGYIFQALIAFEKHSFYFKTTGTFFNDTVFGSKLGKSFNSKNLARKTAILDSWLTIGSATTDHIGVLPEDDTDGNLLTSVLNQSILVKSDGLLTGITKEIQLFKIDLLPFKFNNYSEYVVNDGVLAMQEGFRPINEKNYVLIGQITTDGKLSFGMNVQILTPDRRIEQYVYENPEKTQFLFSKLKYNQ